MNPQTLPFEDVARALAASAQAWSWAREIAAFFSPFGTDSRLHWTGLVAFFALGAAVYIFERRRSGEEASLFGFLFPAKFYRTQSSWVDVKVWLAGRFIKPLIALISLPLSTMLTVVCASAVAGAAGLPETSSASVGTIIAASLLVATLGDLAYYVTHRLSHENRWLWPFHKLHHSAEALTPITAKRNHPVFDLTKAFVHIALTAPASGAIYGVFGVIEFTTIFGLTALIAAMNFAGGALRHSHIWLDYGPVLDRIFISPAQHQIHHSIDPRHHDKNYGLMLAIWDWMFGTLYVPNGREELSFGVADKAGRLLPQRHTSLKTAFLVPFEEATEVAQTTKGSPSQPAEVESV